MFEASILVFLAGLLLLNIISLGNHVEIANLLQEIIKRRNNEK